MLKNRMLAVLVGTIVLAFGATTAVAGDFVGSPDVADNSLRSKDVHDGTIKGRDLFPRLIKRIDAANTGPQGPAGPQGLTGPQGSPGTPADTTRLGDLEARVAALEANAADGNDVNTNWVSGLGATIQDANTVVLDSRNNDGYSYATIANLDLPIQKGAVVEFTYELADGAAAGWGAPRIQIRVNGATYSSAHQVSPDYGHDNGDGTFTVSVPATSMNDNSATLVPEGTITRASLVYDYQDKGTVTFTNVVIDGHPISFQ